MEQMPYKLGVIVGRFQPLHKGHEYLIASALAQCERVGVFIGSSQAFRTEKNPFTLEEREKMLRVLFGSRLETAGLPDIFAGDPLVWGRYVLSESLRCFGRPPDVLVSGKEARRAVWFDEDDEKQPARLYVPKLTEISGTRLRGLLTEDREAEWKKFTPEALWGMYGEMRSAVLASAGQ